LTQKFNENLTFFTIVFIVTQLQ